MPTPTETEPRRTKRQERADARREQLLAAALDVFAEKGYRGSTIRDIARAAGCQEGLIYHYFSGKAALMRAVIQRFSIAGEIDRLVAEVTGLPAREGLRQLGHGFLDVLERNRQFVTTVMGEAVREPEVAAALSEITASGMSRVAEAFERWKARGELRPHDTMALMRMLQGSTLWFFLVGDKLTALPRMDGEFFMQQIMDILWNGIGGTAPAGDRDE